MFHLGIFQLMGASQGTEPKVVVHLSTPGMFVFTSWEVLITSSAFKSLWSERDAEEVF